ncbi:MAG: gliding motility lipoprotein GldB [Bacteroidetes bacterium]|nr:MAG: gliding motility lipoprotein GldB [Bacteroidota bacterium]
MKKIFTLLIACSLIFISCKRNKFDIDVSDVKVDLQVNRFDKELFSINKDSVYYYIPKLEKKYGNFFQLFNYKVINIGGTNNRNYSDYLTGFLTDFTIMQIYKETEKTYSDFDDVEDELTEAFKHYKYYFPQKNVPKIYTYISGFNQSIVTDEYILGIGLDKYLGKNCDFYERLQLPVYLRYKMDKKYIVSDCMQAWAITEFPNNDSVENLLSRIIYRGKIQYFIDAMLPNTPDSIKIAFKASQLNWCEENEERMWTFLIENNLLFSSDYMEIKRYTDPGPFTSGFSRESPSRTGIWLGWQIVKSYMDNNTSVSLKDLMLNNDGQKILNQSKYKP